MKTVLIWVVLLAVTALAAANAKNRTISVAKAASSNQQVRTVSR